MVRRVEHISQPASTNDSTHFAEVATQLGRADSQIVLFTYCYNVPNRQFQFFGRIKRTLRHAIISWPSQW